MVLAYKGAIFGSLMVYIFPALMHASLAAQGVTPLSVQGHVLSLRAFGFRKEGRSSSFEV